MRNLIFILLFLGSINFVSGQTLDITITNIRKGKGDIRIAYFENNDEFENQSPKNTDVISKGNVENGTLCYRTKLKKSGTYAISVLDDENRNGKADNYIFVGIPCEGFGFSNYISKGFKKPHFKDFAFTIDENQTLNINVVMRYIKLNK